LKILPTGYSGSIKNIYYYNATCFKASFPTAFAPEYSRGLTKRKSPLKKILYHYPFAHWNYACKRPISPPTLWFSYYCVYRSIV